MVLPDTSLGSAAEEPEDQCQAPDQRTGPTRQLPVGLALASDPRPGDSLKQGHHSTHHPSFTEKGGLNRWREAETEKQPPFVFEILF